MANKTRKKIIKYIVLSEKDFDYIKSGKHNYLLLDAKYYMEFNKNDVVIFKNAVQNSGEMFKCKIISMQPIINTITYKRTKTVVIFKEIN